MRSFSTHTGSRYGQSALSFIAGGTANHNRSQKALSPWRRSIKATGAFLLCLAIAGGTMLIHEPTGAQSDNNSASGSEAQGATVSQNPPAAEATNTQSSASTDAANNSDGASPSTATSVTVTSNSDANSPPRTTVTVNGQRISIPTNSSTQQTVTDANGTTTVDVSNTSTGDGNSSSSSSTNTSVSITDDSFSAESVNSQTYSSGGGAY